MRVSTALDAFWISRIGQPGYSLIPRYKPLREFDSQSNSQILFVIIKTCLQVRTHCGHISDMFPPPVVFPATREVMEGYKMVSILHISPRCAHTHNLTTAPLHLDRNLFNIKLLSSSHLISDSHYNNITFYFWSIKHSYSLLTNISAADPSCNPVLQHFAAGSLQHSPQSVSTSDSGLWLVIIRLWPLIGHLLWVKTFYHLLRIVVWNLEEKDFCSGNERLSYFLTHWHLISC